MSVKKKIPSLCKLSSFFEEIPEEFLDETDVDSYFYHNIFHISLSQHRIVRVSRGSNKKSFAIKLFQFSDIKTQQRYILQEEVNISKKELTCLVDNLRDFLKTFDQASKCIQIPLPKPEVEIGSTESKDNLFAHYYNDIIEQIDKFVYHSDLETTILAYFLSKSLNYTVINLFIQNLSNLTIVKITISTRTDIILQTSVKKMRAITIVAHSPLIVAMTIALLFSLGTYIVQIQSVQVDFACNKRLFNHLAGAIINVRKVGLCARCALFLLKIKEIPLSCHLVKEFTFLKRTQNQFKMLLEMSIVLASIVPAERNANLLVVM